MPRKSRQSPQLKPSGGSVPLAYINEFANAAEEHRRLNTAQREAIDYLKSLQVPTATYARSDGIFYGMEPAKITEIINNGIQQWQVGLERVPAKRVEADPDTEIPEEVTRRVQWKGPDGKPYVLNRPMKQRATTRDILEMMKYPAIRIGLAARNAYTMRAFRQFSIMCRDPVAKGLARLQTERIIDEAISRSLARIQWGFAPCELVFKRADEKILVEVTGDGETPPVQMDSGKGPSDGSPAAPPQPLVRPPKRKKYRAMVLPGAVTISKVKDLYPPDVELYVRGKLQEFDGLRYMQDDEQRVTALASYVATHCGPFGQMYGESVMDGLKPLWYSAIAVGMFCMYYLERKGDPPAKGFAPPVAGFDANNNAVPGVQLLAAAHNKARTTGGIFLPSVYDANGKPLFDYDYLKDDQRADMFRSYQEHLIRQILWGLLIPDGSLFMNSRVGSFAASATYADVAMNLREIDLAEEESYYNKYLLQKVMDLNFYEKPAAKVKAMLRPDVRRDLLKELYAALLSSEKDGVPGYLAQLPDATEILTQLDIPTSPSE